MARKKKPEEHENHERWLVSYADFITLLFAFFVVMYSVSSVNEGKYRVLSDSLLSAFKGAPKSVEPIQIGKPSKSPVLNNLQFENSASVLTMQNKKVNLLNAKVEETIEATIDVSKSSEEKEILLKIADDVILAMSQLIDLGLINVRKNDLWLEIEIKSNVLYASGSAKLKTSVIPVIKKLASILYNFPNSIRIEGYTDNTNISTNLFPSNWELSSARSSSIARLFELANILSERISVVGYGSTRPVADNDTPEGRNLNRRVVVVIVANNDISRTIKNKHRKINDFPDNELIKKNKLLTYEEQVKPLSINSDAKKLVQKSLSNDKQKFVNPGNEITSSNSGVISSQKRTDWEKNDIRIINPIIAPPIRLFSPILIPTPIQINRNEENITEQ